ncbi:hypothetical protein [Profundibacterium mesophilum]|uniref:Uncharacterized protein n=1 Tax=Profundibacterium mesophilum KAUST100406-0324 TaxID=1037889 RepID=A0A921NWF7_9RHOB|nr:hypothetical protein [Profundibacterium mesophilum]KAF0676923.1 hypothetical protein PMES_00720 [Profundibacterium mesophilum KAUST100406-0324]
MTPTFNDYAELAYAPMQAAMAYSTAFAAALPRALSRTSENWAEATRNAVDDAAQIGRDVAQNGTEATTEILTGDASGARRPDPAVTATAAAISSHLEKQRDDAVKTILGAASGAADKRNA